MPKVFEGKSSKICYISGMFLTFSSSTFLKAGNTRIQFSDLDGDGQISLDAQDGEVIQVLAYYPFGMTIEGLNPADLSDPAYRYRYNGKVEEPNSRMYDYGARWYMPDIGRWGVVDPLGELGFNFATYSYGFNNPIRYLDPDGMWAQDADGNWSTDDPDEIKDFYNALLNASKTGGSIQIVDHEDQDGNAFAIYSIGNNGAYHRAFHSSETGTGYSVQTNTLTGIQSEIPAAFLALSSLSYVASAYGVGNNVQTGMFSLAEHSKGSSLVRGGQYFGAVRSLGAAGSVIGLGYHSIDVYQTITSSKNGVRDVQLGQWGDLGVSALTLLTIVSVSNPLGLTIVAVGSATYFAGRFVYETHQKKNR